MTGGADAPRRAPRPIVLVGLRGVGKTSVASCLARRLGLGCIDLDECIRWACSDACCGERAPSVAEIVTSRGWDGFRDVEERELRRVIESGATVVLAAGGGVVERAENRALLRARATCVWLRQEVEVLRARLAADPHARPSLTGADPLRELDEVARGRERLYAEVAAHSIDCGGDAPEALADRIARLLA